MEYENITPRFSILILTFNEAVNIKQCLDSVNWADDVVVLDSFSTDNTVDIAKRKNARIYRHKFEDFGSQRNYALEQIDFKHEWIFHLDADERFNNELRNECERVIELNKKSAYFVPNRIIFLGRWIPHCTQYPYPQVRLIKKGEVSFAKSGHGQREDLAVRGLGIIETPYDHFNFSKGIEDWLAKHNRYSTEEAKLALEIEPQAIWKCFSRNSIIRRRALKSRFIKMPFRPLLKFLYLYLFQRGFLDGKPGLIYCKLQMIYESMIILKMKELESQKSKNIEL